MDSADFNKELKFKLVNIIHEIVKISNKLNLIGTTENLKLKNNTHPWKCKIFRISPEGF